ncbi:MAG: DUF2721 domain-containing protein [Desulfobacteraceae bacterium]|nr:MAG: DUF2721 domain-containing protein [Desulfobacteraceae bacterium]
MDITLTTPALLFPAISLLLVAYTNRFNTIGGRIRSLHALYKESPAVTYNNISGFHPHSSAVKKIFFFACI